ncbi:MAG: sporulation protein YunB [Oscillospiraceae bacterium]|nr:sporulation protein YunB [Oscillospiraceae bacterium]
MRLKTKRRLRWMLLLLLLLGIPAAVRMKMAPLMKEFVVTQAENTMSALVNEIINREIASGSIDFEKIVSFEKDASGQIHALKTDMSEINRTKTQILSAMNEEISDLSVDALGIPIGNFFFSEFFSGKGFKIPVKVLSVSTTDANFENRFYEAGINQTLHQIRMIVSANLSVMTPTGTVKTEVITDVVVAETILIGAVPQQYVLIGDNLQGGTAS